MTEGRAQRPLVVYAVALAALVAAVLLRWLLDPLMGDTLPLVSLFGAVAVTVWIGGYLPAGIVAILGYVACALLFIEPRGELGLDVPKNLIGFVAYVFTCSIIIGFGEAMRRAQRSANERREVLRVTLASIGDAVITTDLEARITYLNAAAESLTGWTCDEVVGRPLDSVFRIVNEDTRAAVENPAAKALRHGVVVGLANHTLLVRKDGSEIPIDDSAAPIKDEEGRVSGCVLIFRDISERRRLERVASSNFASARLLAAIVESSEDAIVSKSLDGIIQSWNAGAERLFGHTAAEAVGRHISLIIPLERIAEEDQIIASLKAGKRVDHFETERLHRDGRHIQVSLTISPVRDEAGNVVGASKIARDITERRRLAEALGKLAADLSEADRRKDEFLATLAHELRNPLAPLRSMLEVMKRAGGREDMTRPAIDTMDRQLGQMVRLVEDLLDLSRITHNRLELRLAPLELASVLHQAVEASRPASECAGHELQVSVPEQPIFLRADAVRLSQVFGNLLSNACKYTAPGGKISVTVRREGDEAAVSVRDTGTGIPPDKLDSIFEMFSRIERPLERQQGGLGIGLTLVRRLVQMHGGSIEARSAGEGRGSEFIVRLPVALGEVGAASAPPARTQQQARPCRVLVVDDNVDAASSLVMLLRMSGNEASMAHSGTEALDAVARRAPEVLLLDIGLPGMNGYEVCRKIREQPGGTEIRIIALTGWGQEQDRRQSQEAGFDGHLVKPVDYAQLMVLIDSAQQRHQPVQQNLA